MMKAISTLLFLLISFYFYGQTDTWLKVFEFDGKYGIVTVETSSRSIIDTVVPPTYGYIEKIENASYADIGFLCVDEKVDYNHYKGVKYIDTSLKEINQFNEIIDIQNDQAILLSNRKFELFDLLKNESVQSNLDTVFVIDICVPYKQYEIGNTAIGYSSPCKSSREFFYYQKSNEYYVSTFKGEELIKNTKPISWDKSVSLFKSGSNYYFISGEKLGSEIKSVVGFLDHSSIENERFPVRDYLIVNYENGSWSLWKDKVYWSKLNEPFHTFDKSLFLKNLSSDYELYENQYLQDILIFKSPDGFVLINEKGDELGDRSFEEILPIQDNDQSIIYVFENGSYKGLTKKGEFLEDFKWDSIDFISNENRSNYYYLASKEKKNFLLDDRGEYIFNESINAVSFVETGSDKFLQVENEKGEVAYQKMDDSFTTFGKKDRIWTDSLDDGFIKKITTYKGTVVNAIKEYEDGILRFESKVSDGTNEKTWYFSNGKLQKKGSFHYMETNNEVLALNSTDGWIPCREIITFNENGDTLMYEIFSYEDPLDNVLEGQFYPNEQYSYDYNWNGELMNRYYNQLVSNKEGKKFFLNCGWQIHYDEKGDIVRRSYYELPRNEDLESLRISQDEYSGLLTEEISYSENGRVKRKFKLDENGAEQRVFDQNGKIIQLSHSNLDFYLENSIYEWESTKSRYYIYEDEYIEVDNNDVVNFQYGNTNSEPREILKIDENNDTTAHYFFPDSVITILKKENNLQILKDNETILDVEHDSIHKIEVKEILNTIDHLPKTPLGKKIKKSKIQWVQLNNDSLFFYKNTLLKYQIYNDVSYDQYLERSFDYASGKGFERTAAPHIGAYIFTQIVNGNNIYQKYYDSSLVEKSKVLENGEVIKLYYDSFGRKVKKDSSGYEIKYDYLNDTINTYTSKEIFYKNTSLYRYAKDLPMTNSRGILRSWKDTLNQIDSSEIIKYNHLYYPLQLSYMSGMDTLRYIEITKKLTNQTYQYTMKGELVYYKNYSPYQYRNDTLAFICDPNGSILQIELIDTLTKNHLIVNNKNNSLISIDSSLVYKEGFNEKVIWNKKYYANGQLFVDKDSTKYHVYYPNGLLASDDIEFNQEAKNIYLGSGKDKSYFLYRFDFENDVFGNKKNQTDKQQIKLFRPTLQYQENYTSLAGNPDARYSLFRIHGFRHLYDKKVNAFVKYNLFPWDFDYLGKRNVFSTTNNASILKMVVIDHVNSSYLVKHTGKQIEVVSGSNASISPSGNQIVKFFWDNPDSEGLRDRVKVEVIDVESDSLIKTFNLDTSNIKPYPYTSEYLKIQFLDNDEVYTNIFSKNNVISLSEEKRTSTMSPKDFNFLGRNADFGFELNTQTYYLRIKDKNGEIKEIKHQGIPYGNIKEAKFYPSSKKINILSYDSKFYTYHTDKRILDSLDDEVIGVHTWGKTPASTELVVKDSLSFYRIKLNSKDRKPFYYQKQNLDSAVFKDNVLDLHQDKEIVEIKIPGLNKESDPLSDIPMSAYWEASFINKELIFSTSTAHLQNGKQIYFTDDSSSIFFWNSTKKNRIERHIQLMTFSSGGSIFIAPDNYYMLNGDYEEQVYFVKNLKVFPLEQFDLKYNRPDIILDRLGYADSSLIAAYHAAYKKRLKKMGFTEDMLKDDFHLPEIEIENFEEMPTINDEGSINLKLNMNDSKYKLDRINIWVNDVAIYGKDGISLRDKNVQDYKTDLEVLLAKGNNKVQVSVLNQAGAESYKETFEVECTVGKDEPDLYLITIGESEFQQSDFNLTYAAKDAKDVATIFSDSKVYNEVYTKTLTNEEVTKENILNLKPFLEKADINDHVMVFIAGHGVLDANLDYYFATYDMDFQHPQERGIAYEDLESLLDGIKPLKKTLMIDACHSGEIDKEEVTLAQAETTESGNIQFRAVGKTAKPKLGSQNTYELTKSLFTDLRKGTGATVISSAGGMEFAMEGDDWNNGLFTYCLLHGIQTKDADLNGDNEIWLSELKEYVSKQVAELSGGKQQPTSRIENQTVDFRVW